MEASTLLSYIIQCKYKTGCSQMITCIQRPTFQILDHAFSPSTQTTFSMPTVLATGWTVYRIPSTILCLNICNTNSRGGKHIKTQYQCKQKEHAMHTVELPFSSLPALSEVPGWANQRLLIHAWLTKWAKSINKKHCSIKCPNSDMFRLCFSLLPWLHKMPSPSE